MRLKKTGYELKLAQHSFFANMLNSLLEHYNLLRKIFQYTCFFKIRTSKILLRFQHFEAQNVFVSQYLSRLEFISIKILRTG